MDPTVEIRHCDRCQGAHKALLVRPLPGVVEGSRTHYVVCPAKDQPLYIDPSKPNGEEPGPPAAPAANAGEESTAPPSGKRRRELAGTT